MQQLRTALTDRQVLVEGLHAGHGAVVVDRWAGTPAAGWTLEWYDLELRHDGFPFGALLYRSSNHVNVAVRVGLQWDHQLEQFTSIALDENEDRHADNADPDVLRDLERDARGRLGALLGSYATIGSYIASSTAEDALLDAAGLAPDAE